MIIHVDDSINNALAHAQKGIEQITRYGGHYYQRQPDGKPYPSATTILSVLNKGGLQVWRSKLIRAALSDGASTQEAFARPEEHQKNAADIGSRAHEIIEAYTKNGTMPPIDHEDAASLHVVQAVSYLTQRQLTHITAEYMVLHTPHLAGPHYYYEPGYGGMIDYVGWDPHTESVQIIDWKTGNTQQDTHKWQIAAYTIALSEILPKVKMAPPIIFYTKTGTAITADLIPDYIKFCQVASAWQATHKSTKIYD